MEPCRRGPPGIDRGVALEISLLGTAPDRRGAQAGADVRALVFPESGSSGASSHRDPDVRALSNPRARGKPKAAAPHCSRNGRGPPSAREGRRRGVRRTGTADDGNGADGRRHVELDRERRGPWRTRPGPTCSPPSACPPRAFPPGTTSSLYRPRGAGRTRSFTSTTSGSSSNPLRQPRGPQPDRPYRPPSTRKPTLANTARASADWRCLRTPPPRAWKR